MTGIDICRVLKADSHLGHQPVVVVVRTPEQEGPRGAPAPTTGSRSRSTSRRSSTPSAISSSSFPATRAGAPSSGRSRSGATAPSTAGLSGTSPAADSSSARRSASRWERGWKSPSDVRRKPRRTVVAEAIVVRVGQDPDRGLGCRFFQLTAAARGSSGLPDPPRDLGEVVGAAPASQGGESRLIVSARCERSVSGSAR